MLLLPPSAYCVRAKKESTWWPILARSPLAMMGAMFVYGLSIDLSGLIDLDGRINEYWAHSEFWVTM